MLIQHIISIGFDVNLFKSIEETYFYIMVSADENILEQECKK
jgi:hypothetical protein